MKTHTEDRGKLADCHEKENKRADEDAEAAYRVGYVSQLNSVYGPAIEGNVVVHTMGATMIRHLQVNQYIRYWETRSGAGAWAYNAEIEGHTAACRRAQKANLGAAYPEC